MKSQRDPAKDVTPGPAKGNPDDAPVHCGTGKTRLHVEADLNEGARFEAEADQAHYLIHVLRIRAGDRVFLFNGRDGEWLAEVTDISKRACHFQVQIRTRPHQALPDVWLLFAPVKRARLDFIAQKATEMGAGLIRPVLTRRTIVSRVNDERLEANVVEAAEQCGLVALPEVREAIALDRLLDRWSQEAPGRRILFCDEGAEAGGALDALVALSAEGARTTPWAVLIGPEGGFSPEERARLRALPGTVALSLGPRILRADTAAIAALSVFQLVLGDWRHPG